MVTLSTLKSFMSCQKIVAFSWKPLANQHPTSTPFFSTSLKKAGLCCSRTQQTLSGDYVTVRLTRMSAPQGAQGMCLLPLMYRNAKNRKKFGAPISRATGPNNFSLTWAALSQGCGPQNRHRLLLNCTFTFTQTISKSWNKCRVREGRARCPSEARTPLGFPGQG